MVAQEQKLEINKLKCMIKQLTIVITFLTFSINAMAQSTHPFGNVLDFTKTFKLPTRKEVGKKALKGEYTFTVDTNGNLINVIVKDSMGYGFDNHIVTKLSETKNFKVPEFNGSKQAITYTLPLKITLPKR